MSLVSHSGQSMNHSLSPSPAHFSLQNQCVSCGFISLFPTDTQMIFDLSTSFAAFMIHKLGHKCICILNEQFIHGNVSYCLKFCFVGQFYADFLLVSATRIGGEVSPMDGLRKVIAVLPKPAVLSSFVSWRACAHRSITSTAWPAEMGKKLRYLFRLAYLIILL